MAWLVEVVATNTHTGDIVKKRLNHKIEAASAISDDNKMKYAAKAAMSFEDAFSEILSKMKEKETTDN